MVEEGKILIRSFAIAALLGSAVACAGLFGQSLTEHAAAAAGGTIGTAVGKPVSNALGRVFGTVDNSAKATVKAAPTPAAKPSAKPSTKESAKSANGKLVVPDRTGHTATVGVSPGNADSGGGGGSSHRSVASHQTSARREPAEAAAPVSAPVIPDVIAPVVKEPTTQELDGIKVGTPASELRAVLGTPESMISIPDDDGHLRETLQYWSHGEPIGTVRLDNGHVVSVQTSR